MLSCSLRHPKIFDAKWYQNSFFFNTILNYNFGFSIYQKFFRRLKMRKFQNYAFVLYFVLFLISYNKVTKHNINTSRMTLFINIKEKVTNRNRGNQDDNNDDDDDEHEQRVRSNVLDPLISYIDIRNLLSRPTFRSKLSIFNNSNFLLLSIVNFVYS